MGGRAEKVIEAIRSAARPLALILSVVGVFVLMCKGAISPEAGLGYLAGIGGAYMGARTAEKARR